MQFTTPIYLISKNNSGIDEKGDLIQKPEKRKVYSSLNSVRQSEFYQAQASGFKPEMSLIIRSFEYKGEELAEYNNIQYKILRTYDKNNGNIELTLVRGVNNGNAEECN